MRRQGRCIGEALIVALPSANIAVVHRSDGSGTSFNFTHYLSQVSPTWKSGPGEGKDVEVKPIAPIDLALVYKRERTNNGLISTGSGTIRGADHGTYGELGFFGQIAF